MRKAIGLFFLLVLIGGCGGGGGSSPVPVPTPQPEGPNMNGLFEANFRIFKGSTTLSETTGPLILLNSGIDKYIFIDGDGTDTGVLTATATTFSVSVQDQSNIGTGVYLLVLAANGALTADSLNGGGTATITLISGIDSEDLDGFTFDVSINATREGLAPTGTSPNLAGNYLTQLEVIDLLDLNFSGTLNFTLRSPGVYDVKDDDISDPVSMTLVAIGSTWYMIDEDYIIEDLTEYSEVTLLSGTIGQNSLTGGGVFRWESLDGTDNAGLDGAEVQLLFQAARSD